MRVDQYSVFFTEKGPLLEKVQTKAVVRFEIHSAPPILNILTINHSTGSLGFSNSITVYL